MRLGTTETDFARKLKQAEADLRRRDMPRARAGIAEAMALDMDAPQPHNLLGILYELAGDFQAARKHYRAGYALDPNYKPCCRNLERLTGFESSAFLSGRVYAQDTEAAEAHAGAGAGKQH